jgi:dihydropyrimidinase
MDLVIRNANVVTVGSTSFVDIAIADGRLVQLGGEMSALRDIDAEGRVVTPGGVDAHVHLTPTRFATAKGIGGWEWSDDFETGTRAALAGGVTTVGNMSFPEVGTSLADGIALDDAQAQRLAICDYFFHPCMLDPNAENLAAIAPLHEAGHTSIKFFLSLPSFDKNVNAFVRAMEITRANGGIALIHCEDAAIMACCCRALVDAEKTAARYYPESRPLQAEVVSTQRAVGFSETTGCPSYIVHLSSARALAACHDGRSRGIPVYVETRPIYLHLTRERFAEEDGAKYAGAPPLRERSDVDALWAGLQFGNIDTIATDHAPWTLAEKLDPAFNATDLRQGVAELETCMPMLYAAGVLGGRMSLEQFVAVTATNPAKLFGLYPKKGTIAVGSDADLVMWDDHKSRVIDGASMYSRADYSPYDGWHITGWPRYTFSRGEIVCDNGTVVGQPGRGQLVRRGAHRPI